jgi:hypothetical protein
MTRQPARLPERPAPTPPTSVEELAGDFLDLALRARIGDDVYGLVEAARAPLPELPAEPGEVEPNEITQFDDVELDADGLPLGWPPDWPRVTPAEPVFDVPSRRRPWETPNEHTKRVEEARGQRPALIASLDEYESWRASVRPKQEVTLMDLLNALDDDDGRFDRELEGLLSGTLHRTPRRAFRVNVREHLVLTSSGVPVPGGFEAVEKHMLEAERARPKRRPLELAAAAPPAPVAHVDDAEEALRKLRLAAEEAEAQASDATALATFRRQLVKAEEASFHARLERDALSAVVASGAAEAGRFDKLTATFARLADRLAGQTPVVHVHVPEQAPLPAPHVDVHIDAPAAPRPVAIRVEVDPETGERIYIPEELD